MNRKSILGLPEEVEDIIKEYTVDYGTKTRILMGQHNVDDNLSHYLKTFTHEQLARIFFEGCSEKIRSTNHSKKCNQEFTNVRPFAVFTAFKIGEKNYVSSHPALEYLLKITNNDGFLRKPENEISKGKWIERINEVFFSFLGLTLEGYFKDEDTHEFESYLRKCAYHLISGIILLYKSVQKKKEEITEKRRELRNLKQRRARAERNFIIATENLKILREEQHKSEAYLASLVD